MATQDENLKELAELGVTKEDSKVEGILPLKGDETAAQVAEVLKAAKAAVKKAKEEAEKAAKAAEEAAAAVPKDVLVWVKGRTYINDTQRIDGGLYRLILPLPSRLVKSPLAVVEIFEGDIPPRKLTEIAKWSGITHPEDYKEDAVLLAKITVAEFKPF